MTFSVQLKSDLDPVSILALLISISSLAFSIYTWRKNSFRIYAEAIGDLIIDPDDGFGMKIQLRLSNRGGKKAQVNSITFSAGDHKKGRTYVPANPFPIRPPFLMDVGEACGVFFHQERLVEQTGKQQLRCNVWVSYQKRPIVVDVQFSSRGAR
jgi:hypothetical protein